MAAAHSVEYDDEIFHHCCIRREGYRNREHDGRWYGGACFRSGKSLHGVSVAGTCGLFLYEFFLYHGDVDDSSSEDGATPAGKLLLRKGETNVSLYGGESRAPMVQGVELGK